MVRKGHGTPRPRKRFGQHFLRNRAVVHRVIDSINFQDVNAALEIGPGLGALTMLLAERCRRLHLIEIDRDLAAALSERYAENPVVSVHQGDALSFDYTQLANELGEKLLIVGNLPYNISTPLLVHLLTHPEAIHEMTFMLQREIAARLTAEPGNSNYGRLTVNVVRSFAVEKLFEVGPEAFYPVPKVHSSVVRFRSRAVPLGPPVEPDLFSSVVRDAFAQRRKTLRNALKEYEAESALIKLGIDPQLRAEQLSIEQFAELVSALGA